MLSEEKTKQNKIPYVKKNSDGLHYVNEKHHCFGKNSPEDDSKDEGTFFKDGLWKQGYARQAAF